MSCLILSTHISGCEFGDRVSGCRADQCNRYNANTLEQCCETCVDPSKTVATTTSTKRPSTSTTTTTTTTTPVPNTSKLTSTKKPDEKTSPVTQKSTTKKSTETVPTLNPTSPNLTQRPETDITSSTTEMTSNGPEELKRMKTNGVLLDFSWCFYQLADYLSDH